ncbi:uncharacterized protein MYCFIDRAFT_179526 [Pseudocercospora fijiensis CIRAD86]|uniref:Uncharacterized protein n=1 Tax=Pseudocercospora fijiensis (strain CIRAD86) TaxID=383855 RepID=M3A112_PSEFD|nr:uncharacterized protein MYCFIDRAFT_179526 [Pseudocercospora fijiensis CIRAD86]EME78086.1 hypothetical protein MYCFIDRAFT_179526 [Pseudocercospora fijiensis CIRAD86]
MCVMKPSPYQNRCSVSSAPSSASGSFSSPPAEKIPLFRRLDLEDVEVSICSRQFSKCFGSNLDLAGAAIGEPHLAKPHVGAGRRRREETPSKSHK